MAFIDMTGKQVPSVTFHTQQQGKWVDVRTCSQSFQQQSDESEIGKLKA